ncbi:MAG: hybrid-cluster NAD(P)-dependent oxidoreductase [Marinobacterium sp.]|nr:hybrid-cluster NAD(P)-dependent oxidoreductase [Marinobacterium sp.]
MSQHNASETGLSPLLCVSRQDETPDATTFEFRHLDERPFEFQAGQFLTFAVDIADEQLHRAYSISSSPAQPQTVSVTIKRVDGGQVSNFLIDNLQPGHALQAMAPAGDFTLQSGPQQRGQAVSKLVLCCAGSGITPCMSIARWLLDTGAEVEISFIYSARNGDDVIMADGLDQLALHDNVQLYRVLGEPARNGDYQGRLSQALFNDLLPDLDERVIFTCGPAAYMAAVADFADSRGFDRARFYQESFAPATQDALAADAAEVQLNAVKSGISLTAKAGANLLNAMEEAGVAMAAACRSGACGACRCQVLSGTVESSSQSTLSDDEITAGIVLACSTTVQSDLAVEV